MIKTAYDRLVRPHLPRKIGVYNGIPTKTCRLLDLHDYNPDWESKFVDYYRETDFIREGDRVVIVGGGRGVTAVVAAKLVGSSGTVTVYEPSAALVKALRDTMRINGVNDRVTINHGLVGQIGDVWGALGGAEQIEPSSLPNCDVLELNCEGGEAYIVPAMEIRPRGIAVQTHQEFGVDSESIHDHLRQYGYGIIADVGDDYNPTYIAERKVIE